MNKMCKMEKMKKVIVTGADGFLGKNLVYKLLENCVSTWAVVYPGNNVYEGFSDINLHVISADLNEAQEYIDQFEYGVDVMYHLAWQGVRPELRDNIEVQMRNIEMTTKCMELASKLGVKKIIMPGSTNEYLKYGKPINKEAVPSPTNAYGATKVALRYLCGQYAKQNKIEFVYAIIAGIYAADRRDNNVIFYTIDKLLKREKPFLTKLEQLWDYVYIDDVIDALIATGQKGRDGAVYAIGHGDNWELSNYIRIIHNKIDSSLPLGIGDVPYDSETLPCSCIDLTDIREDTGFVPKVDFEEGITRVIERIKAEM